MPQGLPSSAGGAAAPTLPIHMPTFSSLAQPTYPLGMPGTVPHVHILPNHADVHSDCSWAALDWRNLDLQIAHAACCHTPEKTELFSALNQKLYLPVSAVYRPVWKQLAHTHHYDVTASILASSNYSRREDFVHCGEGTFRC